MTMSGEAKAVRRIVTIDDEEGRSLAIADGPAPDVRGDPARPGFSSTRIWLTYSSPPVIAGFQDPVAAPHTIEPPRGGSLCRIVTFLPDDAFRGKVGAKEVAAFFHAMGSPGASTYSAKAPHPYMQQSQTLDFCLVLDGEITLVLDTAEVHLTAGDTVVQRGTNHAWSNRSSRPCTVAFSLHDAAPVAARGVGSNL
jgi:Cupin domain